jgi:L-ascorbate metabolism protein UlaG (beta-lactamase superfamily)
MKLTCYGHSCFAVETGGKSLLFDPYITPNELASSIDPATLRPDYILLSHGHMDHCADAESIARASGATLISGFEVVEWFSRKGIEKSHSMNHGGGFNFDFGRLTYTWALHSSSMPDGSYGGNPGGFLVEAAEGAFYYSGDTALTFDMKLIAEATTLKFAVLPIGDNFTMGARDATRAAGFLGVKDVVGVHYDTFPPIKIDHAAAHAAFAARGVTLHLPEIGASVNF